MAMSFRPGRDRTRQTQTPGRSSPMLRHILNLRTHSEPTRPARDVIIEARRRARRELLRAVE